MEKNREKLNHHLIKKRKRARDERIYQMSRNQQEKVVKIKKKNRRYSLVYVFNGVVLPDLQYLLGIVQVSRLLF